MNHFEMKNGDRIGGVCCLVLSLAVAIESYGLGLGTLFSPEAGLFPFLISIILGILSLALFVAESRTKGKTSVKTGEPLFNRQTMPQVSYIMASVFGYIFLLNTLGFILDTTILIGFLLRLMEPKRWYVVLVGGLSVSLVAYALFSLCLKVQLPRGILGF